MTPVGKQEDKIKLLKWEKNKFLQTNHFHFVLLELTEKLLSMSFILFKGNQSVIKIKKNQVMQQEYGVLGK